MEEKKENIFKNLNKLKKKLLLTKSIIILNNMKTLN